MKVAIVYDRVNKFGGAERFLKTIISIFPQAPIYTLVADQAKVSWTSDRVVIPSFLNKIKFFRSRHELLAPIAPLAFETHNLKQFDLIISVTSSDAKSVVTLPHQTHICICLTPNRYLWSGKSVYRKDIKLRILPKIVLSYFKFVDKIFANRPDFFIAISKEVQRRIHKYYNKESVVIYPPIESHFFVKKAVIKNRRKYFLVVSRLVPYKKVDLVVKVFNKLKDKLVIVGEGSELNKLKKIAGNNIKFTGSISDEDLKKYYRFAKAVIFPQNEDFGLVPLESQASGTPVIAYKKGGALETIIKNKTGVFFNKQNTSSLKNSVLSFKKLNTNYMECIKNAHNFSEEKFKEELLSYVNQVV